MTYFLALPDFIMFSMTQSVNISILYAILCVLESGSCIVYKRCVTAQL